MITLYTRMMMSVVGTAPMQIPIPMLCGERTIGEPCPIIQSATIISTPKQCQASCKHLSHELILSKKFIGI